METQELLRKVRQVEIKTRGRTNQMFAGEYHSAFKGRGMSFAEVREYQYGDDVRNIDWNVSARMDTPYIKVFEEERELTFMLLIDVSGSAFFGTRSRFKSELMTELCATLAFSAIRNNDKVGVLFFSNGPEQFIPPRKGRSHTLRIIRELIDYTPRSRGTDLGESLRYVSNLVKKRSILFVLSDFVSQPYLDPLRIVARRHDLVGVRIYDPAEAELPKVGWVPVADPETGRTQWLNTNRKRTRRQLAASYRHYRDTFQEAFRRARADTIEIATHDDYIKRLHEFFRRREHRA